MNIWNLRAAPLIAAAIAIGILGQQYATAVKQGTLVRSMVSP